MKTVLQTNDLVLLSLTEAVLRDAAIDCIVLDQHMSALDGSIGAIPRRLVVPETQADRAQQLVDAVQAGSWDGPPDEADAGSDD